MSAETKEDVEMNVEEVVDGEDEIVSSFKALDSSSDLESKIADFETLLQNPRYDEKAVKIKEQCIYRYAPTYCPFAD